MTTTGNIGFEETLWKAADKLRGSTPKEKANPGMIFG